MGCGGFGYRRGRDTPFLTGKVIPNDEACFSSRGTPGGPQGDCPDGTALMSGPGAAAPCTYSADCTHGTHVAGIAAGRSTINFSGVARGANLDGVQVFFNDPKSTGTTASPID